MEVLTNRDAERTVIGCILSDPGAVYRALPLLKPEDFSLDSHRRIFHTISELANAGKPTDDLSVCTALAEHGQLESVGAEAVDNFISDLLQKGKASATVNRSTQLLAQAFKLAIERRRLSIAPHIRHLSERGNARQGFFADWEFRAVVENLPDYLKDFARFGYLTGWRKQEVKSLRWEDVDGDVIRLRGRDSKNREPRSVVLHGELAELIQRRKRARQVEAHSGVTLADLVFHHDGQTIVDFRKAWATACAANGLGAFYCRDCRDKDKDGKYIRVLDANKKCSTCGKKWAAPKYIGKLFHDFRRTAVRNMVRAGVPERVAMSISGHKTRSIFDRYNIVSERDLRDAMKRTQSYLVATAEEEAKRQPVRIRGVQ